MMDSREDALIRLTFQSIVPKNAIITGLGAKIAANMVF
jgi:hypothetical protein